MPLIAVAYLAFTAGLLSGFARAGIFPIAAALGLVAALVYGARIKTHLVRGATALVFAGGVAFAWSDSRPREQRQSATRSEEHSGVLERIRLRAGRTIDRTFKDDAPIVRALLIADTHDVPIEVRDEFVNAGLVHILSISGLHVGIIAVAVQLLLEAARIAKRRAAILSLIIVAAYVAIIGAPPPALRAAAMVSAVTTGKITQRPTSPWALLAIGAFIPLFQPATINNLGYQLSVAGIAALIASGALARRWLKPRFSGFRLTLARDVAASLLATVVTAPLIAWYFGRISLVGPLSNVVANPIVALLQPALFLGLLLAPVPWLGAFVADASHPLLAALQSTAVQFGSIPGAVLEVSPSWPVILAAGVAVAALIMAIVSRFPARPCVLALGCCAFVAVVPIRAADSNFEMHMLDVGQGDAILIRTPHGHWILFDAGRSWRGGDAGRSVVIPYLQRRGGTLDEFVLSHPHMDHVGGASTVIRALHPREYWDAAFAAGSPIYHESLVAAERARTSWRRVRPGDSLQVDGVNVSFLGPDSSWVAGLKDPNLASTIALVRFGRVRFLLVGDAEKPEEDWLLQHAAKPLRADVLKVGHHGSSTSSSDNFIAAVCPQIALISVGAQNSYGHPSADVIASLRRLGAEVLRTDKVGTIIVRTDGNSIEMNASNDPEDGHWRYSAQSIKSYSENRSTCRTNWSDSILH